MVAPSDMMDGRVRAIRESLDSHGHKETPIMSCAENMLLHFTGRFVRQQILLPPLETAKAIRWISTTAGGHEKRPSMHVEEGADILMVKPALSYLDVLSDVVNATNVPVAAYSVSGEYAMVKDCRQNGMDR